MNKFPAILCGVSFALFCLALGFCVSILVFPFGLFHPVIACDTKAVALGVIDNDKDVDCRFEIRNTGNRTLELREISPACGSGNEILDINCSLEPLPPGKNRMLTLRFHPYSCQGDVTKKLVIASNDPQSPLFSVSISATVNFVPPPKMPGPTLASMNEGW